MTEKRRYNLTEGNIFSGIWRLSVPMVASMILHDVLQLVDLFFLGRLGAAYVAGLTMGGVFVETFFTLAMGISTGTVALVARYVGAGKKDEAHNVVVQSVFIGFFLSLVMTLLGLFLAEWALSLLGTKGEVKALGAIYLRIVALGSIFIFIPFNLNSALRGAGDALTPLKIMIVSNLLNIILAPLLIFGLLGFPRWEMAGAAWAVVISRGAGAVLSFYVFFSGKSYFRLQIKDIKFDLRVTLSLIRIGFFGSLQMLFRNLSALFIARLVAIFGVTAIAAYGIVIRLRMSVLLPGLAIGNAAATLVGQNIGAGKPERAVKTGWSSAGLYSIFMIVITLAFMLFAKELVNIFNQDLEVIAEGSLFLRIFSATFIFLAFSSVLGRAINGAGDTFSPMIITGLAILGLRIPLAYLLALNLGPEGIWIGMALSNVFQGVIFTVWF
ncbi:MAG: MATE family efflux transporter, partial [Deltaproteobacteria bacterium]|nr:MATE family efflux transporter [Deltaproteobacteria bacterium]